MAMNALFAVRHADDEPSEVSDDDDEDRPFEAKAAMTLDEWEDLVGPDFVAIRENRWPESDRWRHVVEITDDSPFERRRNEILAKQQAANAGLQPQPMLPAGARRLPPSPRNASPRNAASARRALSAQETPSTVPRRWLSARHAQPAAPAVLPRQGIFIAQNREASPRRTATPPVTAFPPRFARPQLAQQVQTTAQAGLQDRPPAPPDVPAAAHHPKRERGVKEMSGWPVLPQRWPQHLKTQKGQITDPKQPGVPFVVARGRREAASDRLDVERELFW